MTGAFDIRLARDGDLDAMGALYGVVFDPLQPRMAVEQYLTPPGAFALVAESGGAPVAESEGALVAESGGEIAGFIIGQSITTDAEIFSVGVSVARRRQGVGAVLVEKFCVVAAARGAESVFLEVAVDNPGAVALYEYLGFVEAGRRKNYYRDPGGVRIDAIVMRFDLITRESE